MNGKIIRYKDLEYLNIMMEDNIQENGKIIKKMDMGNSFVLKEKNMLAFIKTTKKTDSGFIIGHIIISLSDFGKKGNKMVSVNI